MLVNYLVALLVIYSMVAVAEGREGGCMDQTCVSVIIISFGGA